MPRKKANETLSQEDPALMEIKRPVDIIAAEIKDGYCHYSYEIKEGLSAGDTHAVKGIRIVHDDMKNAFSILNVHLAFIDDIFKHSEVNFDFINAMHSHELTDLFRVTGFKIRGSDESESVILIGNKYVSTGGRIDMETPKIAMDKLSSYKWHDELKNAVEGARREVYLYFSEAKCTPTEEEKEEISNKRRPRQMRITDGEASGADGHNDELGNGGI